MNIKKEAIIIVTIILTVYLIAIPLTTKILHEYRYDNITLTYEKVKAIYAQNITDAYTIALKGPIIYESMTPMITINNKKVTLSKIVRGGTFYYGATITEEPTVVRIRSITFKKHTPLTDAPQITYLLLTIVAVTGVAILSDYRGKTLIKKRRIFIITMILLSATAFTVLSTKTYTAYEFSQITFTATTTVNVIKPNTYEIHTPYTAKILPLGSDIRLTITAPDTTYTAYYYDRYGYIFTAEKPYKTMWINGTTATLQTKYKYIWQLAAAYTVVFIILFGTILFAYSYFVFDILGEEPKQ